MLNYPQNNEQTQVETTTKLQRVPTTKNKNKQETSKIKPDPQLNLQKQYHT